MLSEKQKSKAQLDANVRGCISRFVREVEKAKVNPIYNRFKVIISDVYRNYEDIIEYACFDISGYIDYINIDIGDGWFVDFIKNKICIPVDYVIKHPKEVATSLLKHVVSKGRTITSDDEIIIEGRIIMVDECITENLSEKLIEAMEKSVKDVVKGVNNITHHSYLEKKESILNNKANYHAGNRQKPIARNLRGYKTTRKSGLHQLENSVRRMW